jgi:hypothetical protein
MVPTIAELRVIDLMRDYEAIRKRRYGNTIPPVEEVAIKFVPRKELNRLSGFDDNDTEAYCSCGKHKGTPVPQTILLADDLREDKIRISLLHEMGHFKVNLKFGRSMGHGEYWLKEMRHLAAVGEMDAWW